MTSAVWNMNRSRSFGRVWYLTGSSDRTPHGVVEVWIKFCFRQFLLRGLQKSWRWLKLFGYWNKWPGLFDLVLGFKGNKLVSCMRWWCKLFLCDRCRCRALHGGVKYSTPHTPFSNYNRDLFPHKPAEPAARFTVMMNELHFMVVAVFASLVLHLALEFLKLCFISSVITGSSFSSSPMQLHHMLHKE